jgi:hypothetical protein
VISEGARIVLSVLDEAKAELERDHPGWRIWFVPRTMGRRDGARTVCPC